MNIVIALLLVAVVSFVLGAWSLITISRRSPKIYEIEPVVGAIVSDVSNLLGNFQKLFYLTTEVTQGILKGSEDISSASPKLVQAEILEEKQEEKKEQSAVLFKDDDVASLGKDNQEEVNTDNNSKQGWFGSLLGEIVRSNEGIQKAAEDPNEGLVEEKKIESVPLDYKSMEIYRENYQGDDQEDT